MRQIIFSNLDGSYGDGSGHFTPVQEGSCVLTCFGSAYTNTPNQYLTLNVLLYESGSSVHTKIGEMKLFSNPASQHKTFVPFTYQIPNIKKVQHVLVIEAGNSNTIIDEGDFFTAFLDF